MEVNRQPVNCWNGGFYMSSVTSSFCAGAAIHVDVMVFSLEAGLGIFCIGLSKRFRVGEH